MVRRKLSEVPFDSKIEEGFGSTYARTGGRGVEVLLTIFLAENFAFFVLFESN